MNRVFNLALGCLLCLTLMPASAQPASSDRKRNPVPDALQYLDPDCVAWGVLSARPEDKGFQALLRTAWQGMRDNPTSSAPWLGVVSAFLSQATQEDVLLGFLPFQGVRVDRLDEKGQDHFSTVVTMSGWPGVQSLFWSSLLNGPDGKPFQTRTVNGETIVLRPKAGQEPTQGPAMARVKGSFMAFSDLATGELSLTPRQPSGEVYTIASKLDKTQDTMGVLLNRKESLLRFLTWLDAHDVNILETGLGRERLQKDISKIEYVTWVGDLLSDDRMDLEFHFHTQGETQAEEVAEMLKEARGALKDKGRAAELQMTTVRGDVIVRIEMVGFREMLQSFLKRPL